MDYARAEGASVGDGHSSGLARRMRDAIGDRSHRDVAKLTGQHPEMVRRYLSSGRVSTDFAVRLAIATGVRLEWLLTGHGQMTEAAYRLHAAHELTMQNLLIVLGGGLSADRRKIELLEAKVAVLEALLAAGAPARSAEPRESTRARATGTGGLEQGAL
jgi:hypothetical protein